MRKLILLLMAVAIVVVTLSKIGVLEGKAPRALMKMSHELWGGDPVSTDALFSEAAIVVDASDGQVLYKKNEHKRLYPASTTKLLTAMIALEVGNPDSMITVGDEAHIRTEGESSAGLRRGQQLSLRDLVAAMMLPSGNDAARTVARYIARIKTGKRMLPEEGMAVFAGMMNARAKELGATGSHFFNPHGLHDANHYTTAADLALIARKAYKNKLLREIVNQRELVIQITGEPTTLTNTNKLLQPGSEFYYDEAGGMKTGYTSDAGYCLISSAKRGGKQVIAVILHSSATEVWLDSKKLLQYGLDNN